MTTTAALIDKWLVISLGEFYQTGQVIASVGTSHVLVRLRPREGGTEHQRLFDINLMDCDCGNCRSAFFFDKETDLDAWLAWADTPNDVSETARVIDIKKKH